MNQLEYERQYDELVELLDDGMITKAQFNQEVRDLEECYE